MISLENAMLENLKAFYCPWQIKRQEAAARAQIRSNPVKMSEIRSELKDLKRGKEGTKHKKEKKPKKEHKEDRSGKKAKRKSRDRSAIRDRHEELANEGMHRRKNFDRSCSQSPTVDCVENNRELRSMHPHFDGASSQRQSGLYGLNAGHVPQSLRKNHDLVGESTRKRLQVCTSVQHGICY